MDSEPEPPIPPLPPQLERERPAPPAPETLRPGPPAASGHPMMDFLQRRLESLEKDLLLERERARAAQNALDQQQALRAEVESHLKAMGEQLRREKAERESEEARSHAQGRIDALEKRLDETHQSFAALLREAIAQKDTGAQTVAASQSALTFSQADLAREQSVLAKEQAGVRQEIAALGGTIQSLLDQIGHWRAEARGITDLAPELRGLSRQVPESGRRLEDQLNQRLANLEAGLKETLAEWRHQQKLEAEKQDGRLMDFAREKAALERAWEEQNHGLREEFHKESLRRQGEAAQGFQELHRRLDALSAQQSSAGTQGSELQAKLSALLERMTATAPAKDQVIQSLERERDDLLKALRDKASALQRYNEQRREIERTLGESVAGVHHELDDERQKNRVLASRVSELEAQAETWKDRVASGLRLAKDQEEKAGALAAERDQVAKAWHAELERARQQVEERDRSQAQWQEKVDALRRQLEEESQRRMGEEAAAAALRTQIATLAEQLSRALQERDAVVQRFSSWEAERKKLFETIKEKDEMISMLNATFQSVLKKP